MIDALAKPKYRRNSTALKNSWLNSLEPLYLACGSSLAIDAA
jgi:hypothetical protein